MEGHLLNCCLFSLLQAGMHAVRENRYIVLAKDFEKGYKNNIKKDESEHEFYK
jgi:26S proteasome regulatory subunit T3